MNSLFYTFWRMVLLRATPQSIPLSSALLTVLLTVHFTVGALLAFSFNGETNPIVVALASTGAMVIFLFVVLRMQGLQQRLVQTVTALAGCEILIGLLALPLNYLFYASGGESNFIALVSLLIFGWNIVVAAHIFQHALNLNPQQAVFYAVFYIFTALALGVLI